MDAFLDGMERAKRAGRDLSSIASVASFFVSRVDTEVDARLDKIGTPRAAALRGRAAIANAAGAGEPAQVPVSQAKPQGGSSIRPPLMSRRPAVECTWAGS